MSNSSQICSIKEIPHVLLEGNVVGHQGLGEEDAVLEVDVPVGHAVSQEEGLAADVLGPVDEAAFLVAPVVFRRNRKSHVPLRVGALCNGVPV
jgi:rRNA processing protein Gar1